MALGFSIAKRIHKAIEATDSEDSIMTITTAIPPSRNEDYGFWGTMKEQAAAAWPLAMTAIAKATGEPFDSVQIFLDSRHGRHFADDVRSWMLEGLLLADAVQAATRQ